MPMKFTFQISQWPSQSSGPRLVPRDVMGRDTSTGREVYIVISGDARGNLVAEAQKFGLKSMGRSIKELLSEFEKAYDAKYSSPSSDAQS